jgi:hypothetical protein
MGGTQPLAFVRRRPSADEVLAERRKHTAKVKRLGHARRVYEAGLRSGWDSYHTVRADISGPSRQVTTVEGGAIAAARTGSAAWSTVCARASR